MANPWEMDWSGTKVHGGAGSGVGSQQEQKRFTALQDQGDQARQMMRSLLMAKQLVNQQPTGVIPGAVQGIKRMFGSDTMPTQAREQLGALQNQMVMAFRQPGTGQISDAERASFRDSLFSPNYQRGSNDAIIGSRLADQWANLARAQLAAKWRAGVGSLDAKSPKGMTFDQAVTNMQRSPSFRAGLERARTINPLEYNGGAAASGSGEIDFTALK